MTWLFRLAFRGQFQHIQHLRREIAWLREQLLHERGRAEDAINKLLVWRAHVDPVSAAPTPPVPAMTPEQEFDHWMQTSEAGAIGSSVGVER